MLKNKHHLFLVEDDLSFGAVLKSYLELNNYCVTWIDDGKNAVSQFRSGDFALCILDVMLPNVDGFTVGREIRNQNADIPILFLTAKTMKEDIIKGYQTGADDYITKPFDTELLLLKLKAILKRQGKTNELMPVEFLVGNYTFNPILRTIEKDGQLQKLSPKESELLKLLCMNQNELLPRDEALLKIWGDDGYFTARSMDVYITKLRKYLSNDPSVEIKNIHSSGFVLEIK